MDQVNSDIQARIALNRESLRTQNIRGEWETEPDRIEFKYKGLPCMMARTPLMVWCGYVAVTADHPLYGKNYNDVDLEVHGGLTYSDHCQGHICHIPPPGEPDDVWWFGFDCGHFMDQTPTSDLFMKNKGFSDERMAGTYRNVSYVQKQCEFLAEQLKTFVS